MPSAYIRVMSKLGYAIAAALGLAAMGVAWQAWTAMADVQIDIAGIIAMILGAVGALALGGVLMACSLSATGAALTTRPVGEQNRAEKLS